MNVLGILINFFVCPLSNKYTIYIYNQNCRQSRQRKSNWFRRKAKQAKLEKKTKLQIIY